MNKNIKKEKISQQKSRLKTNFNEYLFERNFWKKNLIAAVILFILGFGLYVSTSTFEYVLDDQIVITENSFTNRGLAGISDIFTHDSFQGYFGKKKDLVEGARYRPLSIVTFAIERQFFQQPKEDGYGNLVKDKNGVQLYSGNPNISHFINVLLYTLTALLLFRVLALMFPVTANEKWYLSIPFAASLIFIVHPIHAEVVANIKGRDELLSVLFSLSSLYFMWRYLSYKRFIWMLLSAVSFFLGLLSKENAITFLIIIPLTVYFFSKNEKPFSLNILSPLLITMFIYLLIRYHAIGNLSNKGEITNIMNNPFYGMRFDEKMATIIYTLGLYIKLLFYPVQLTHDYYPYAIPKMQFTNFYTIISLLIYIVITFIAVKGFRNKKSISYSIIFYFITLSIVSNVFISVGSFMNDRFIYMSSIGYCIAISYVFLHYFQKITEQYANRFRIAGIGIIVLISALYSFKTIARIPAWKNFYTLIDADVSISSGSCNSNCFKGVNLYKQYLKETDEARKKEIIYTADSFLVKSLQIYPRYSDALQMYGGVITEEFKYDKDVKKLLDRFYFILERKENMDYIDQYLNYMNSKPENREHLVGFYHHAGFELLFKQLNKPNHAKKFIQWGLNLDPNNQQLLSDFQQIKSQ